MNVQIFNVLDKNGRDYSNERGRQFLVNLANVANPVKKSNTSTIIQVQLDKSGSWPNEAERWIVEADKQSIQQSIAGDAPAGVTIAVTPNKINGATNTAPRTLNLDDFLYAVANGSDIDIYIKRENRLDKEVWKLTSTTLKAWMNTVVSAAVGNVGNQGSTVTIGAATISTQAVTYDVTQAGTLRLEVFNGSAYITIDEDSVSAGSGSHTFVFNAGDIVLNDIIRIGLVVGAQYFPIRTAAFANAGGSGSGSGSTGDCNMYAYWDGDEYNDTYKTLNWGASCSTGYYLEVATDNAFTDKVITLETEVKIMTVKELAAGTYYARVRNISGETRFSPTLTFTKSGQ